MIEAMWYPSLVFAILSVSTGIQQNVVLTRLRAFPNGPERIRNLLGTFDGNVWAPRPEQLKIWQFAVQLLDFSIYTWLGGFAVYVWNVTKMHSKMQSGANIAVSPRSRKRIYT